MTVRTYAVSPTRKKAFRVHGPARVRRILLWHVHGSWTTAFVESGHTCVLPLTPDRGPDGRGRARTWEWPSSTVEVPTEQLHDFEVDLVVLQRPHELQLAEQLLGRAPGRDVPAVYVEHNTPRGEVPDTRHPLADRSDIPIVHVTHFNALLWDCGRAPVRVVEHGVPDPGHLYTGEQKRWRWPERTLAPHALHRNHLLPRSPRRYRWTCSACRSNRYRTGSDCPEHTPTRTFPDVHAHRAGAKTRLPHPCAGHRSDSLIEAMMMGLPVAAVGATEAYEAVPPEAGVVSTDPRVLVDALHEFLEDDEHAARTGTAAREAALRRYGLSRFLDDWEQVLEEVTR